MCFWNIETVQKGGFSETIFVLCVQKRHAERHQLFCLLEFKEKVKNGDTIYLGGGSLSCLVLFGRFRVRRGTSLHLTLPLSFLCFLVPFAFVLEVLGWGGVWRVPRDLTLPLFCFLCVVPKIFLRLRGCAWIGLVSLFCFLLRTKTSTFSVFLYMLPQKGLFSVLLFFPSLLLLQHFPSDAFLHFLFSHLSCFVVASIIFVSFFQHLPNISLKNNLHSCFGLLLLCLGCLLLLVLQHPFVLQLQKQRTLSNCQKLLLFGCPYWALSSVFLWKHNKMGFSAIFERAKQCIGQFLIDRLWPNLWVRFWPNLGPTFFGKIGPGPYF